MGRDAPFYPDITSELEVAVSAPWPNQFCGDIDNRESFPPKREYDLGNRLLPIARYREELVRTILDNEVVVVDAKTGSGKSTQLPQMLFETGQFDRIIQTQPRIIAAREVGHRIASEMSAAGHDGSRLVGFQTASERNETPDNAIVITTDGLAIRHMLTDGKITKRDVVIIDEFHERNANMDAALALCHEKSLRTVITSATLDTARVAAYSSRARGGQETPVLKIPGRMFEIEERDNKAPMHDAIVSIARELRKRSDSPGILAFVPGRSEAYNVASRIAQRVPNGMTMLILNADQTPEEQARALKEYPGGKIIIATDVAKTSLTIPGVDVVVDGGYERSGDFHEGVHGLPIHVSSESTIEQRKGRAGRTHMGIYVPALPPSYPPIAKDREHRAIRPMHDIPQIQRVDLAAIALRTLDSGIDLGELDLLDPPAVREVADANKRLTTLGAIDADMKLGQIGHEMAGIPLDPNYARMLVEARNYSPAVQLKLMACLAACQQKSICSTEKQKQQWRYLSPHENRSDILIQGDLLIRSLTMTPEKREEYNFVELRRLKALKTLERLAEDAGMDISNLSLATEDERRKMLTCIIKGSNELFSRIGDDRFRDRRGHARELSDSSVVNGTEPIILGVPLNISHMRSSGIRTQAIVVHAVAVDIEMLQAIVPERLEYIAKALKLSSDGSVLQLREVFFDGMSTRRTVEVPVEPSEDTREYLINALIERHAGTRITPALAGLNQALDELRDLQNRTSKKLNIAGANIIISAEVSKADFSMLISLEAAAAAVSPSSVRAVVDDGLRSEIYEQSPDVITIATYDGALNVGVEYLKNEAYLTVPVQHLHDLPAQIIELRDRKLHVRVNPSSRYMPIQEAIGFYSRESRDIRRGNMPEPSAGSGPVQPIIAPQDIHPTNAVESENPSVVRGTTRR